MAELSEFKRNLREALNKSELAATVASIQTGTLAASGDVTVTGSLSGSDIQSTTATVSGALSAGAISTPLISSPSVLATTVTATNVSVGDTVTSVVGNITTVNAGDISWTGSLDGGVGATFFTTDAQVEGHFRHTGTTVQFFNKGVDQTKLAVTGTVTGGTLAQLQTAFHNLVDALEAYGLVTDSTT